MARDKLVARLARLDSCAVSDAPVRDVDEARKLGFPVFGRSATARTARGRIAEEASDVPVTIGEVAVRPGDYAIADGSAVVFIAAAYEHMLKK